VLSRDLPGGIEENHESLRIIYSHDPAKIPSAKLRTFKEYDTNLITLL
jgi:hypothetical protein